LERENTLKINFLIIAALTASSTWAADATAGKAVFATKCKSCHGADGEGNPAIAKASTADVNAVVTKGQGKMKPVSSVTGADLDNVVAYVKSLKK